MAINYEVYGQPETWQNCFYAGGSTAAWTTLLNGEKAKVPTWKETHPDSTSYATSQLRYAVDDGKIQERVPIDNSIAAIGQGLSSPFRKWFVYANIADDEHPNGQIRNIGQAYTGNDFNDDATPINAFWFEANNPTAYAISGNAAFSAGLLPLATIERRIWSPSGENAEGTDRQNGNYYISPFMSYGTRSFCLQIMVFDAGEYNPEYTPGGTAPSGTWRTLEQWKNNYPTHAITAAWFRIRSLSAYNTTTGVMGYYAQNYGSSEYRKISSGILDTIKFELDDGTAVPELTDYALFGATYNAELGVRVFTPHSDLYKWQNNLQNILLYPTEISSYIKSNGSVIVPYVPYSDEFYEYLMRACACFGMPFTPAKSTGVNAADCQFNQDFTDVDLCLPVIDDNGIANGDYTRGTGNLDNDFIDLSDIRDKGYDPSIPPSPIDPNTYSNVTGFNYITEGAAMTVRYVLDGANVDKLLSDLWTINASIAQGGDFEYFDGKIKDEYLTTNPIDCIVSLIRYPFNIPYQLQPLQSYVKLGKTEGSAKGWTTVYIANQINFQGINIFPRFGDCFLDYEPYTTYELYVPFCGTMKIRAADILGHTLNVTMLIDLITGSCTAYVKADQLVIETLQGSCGIQQQISGTDTATMNANIYNGILAQKQAKVGMIAQGASALMPSSWVNPAGYAAKGEQAEATYKQATFAIEHMETPVHSQGAASPLLGWIQEFDARLLIYYPEGDVIESTIPPRLKQAPIAAFGHLKGFATVTPGTVGAFRSSNAAFISGDIIAGNIPCTLSERNRIKSMFADGVYLPPL